MAVLFSVLVLGLMFPLQGHAQGGPRTLSVSFKDKPLYEILDYISKHGDSRVTYDNDVKTYGGTLTVSLDEVTPEVAVQSLLAKTPFAYSVQGSTIRVYKMDRPAPANVAHKLTGQVKSSTGETIPMATILVKGTKTGVTADADGNFTVQVGHASGDIVVSCIGYETKTVHYNNTDKALNIVLKDISNTIGEVSVIAYGTRNTREIVGAISSVKSSQLQNVATPSLETLLQGRMSGVEVTNVSGSPGGGGTQVTIRGYSSLNNLGSNSGAPLYVIDGVPVLSTTSAQTGGINPLSSLDPTTIESVDVLKDAASASLYGSRAGNGVILIKTKRGKSGRAQVNINVSQSLSYLPATPVQTIGKGERDLYVMLAKKLRIANYDYMTDQAVWPQDYNSSYMWEPDNAGAYDYFWRNGHRLPQGSLAPIMAQDSLNTFYNNSTNWWKYSFRVGSVTKLDVDVSGGTENVKYMVAAGAYSEKGIMINSHFKRASFTSNLDFKLSTKLDAFARVNMSYTDKSLGGGATDIQGLTTDPKQTPSILPGKGSVAETLALQQLRDVSNKNHNYNIRLNVGLKYNILKGLVFSSTGSIDHYRTETNRFSPNYLQSNLLTYSSVANFGMTMLQTENILTYNLNLKDKHNLELMAGVTYNRDILNTINGEAYGGPSNSIHYISEGWPKMRQNSEGNYEALQGILTNFEEQAMMSFLGRAAYNYKKKYLMELSVRSDGSSVFGRDVRWATFPSVGLGWAFTEEPFMKNLWWLNFGKVRASWGRSGQKFNQAYLALGTLIESNLFKGVLGMIPQSMANSKLTWEKSDQYDLGLDLQMLDYRLRVKLDYYYKTSSALLMQTPLPGNVFFLDKVWNNASTISNEGVELEISGDLIRRSDMLLTLGFNISRNWNMFRKSYGGTDLPSKVIGRPIYGLYTYHDEGIVQKEEDIPYYYNQLGKRSPLYFNNENYPLRVGGRKLKDQNMDGRIDYDDQYYAGSTIPLAYGGFTADFTWKNFTVSALFNYMLNRKIINTSKNSAFSFTRSFGVVMDDLTKASFWQKPGDDTKYPSIEYADGGYIGQFDGNIDSNIENVSFLRLKQLTISYGLPTKWFKKMGLKECKVYLTGSNLFLLDNYSGIDPEIVNPYTGKDGGEQYPLNREFTFGVNLKF